MNENIALDSSSQSAFTKAFKTLKKGVKKGVVKIKPSNEKVKDPTTSPGIVYLSHIPHGFYEGKLFKYFSQFGKVTAVKVVRSEKTGRSCGYAFVQFLHADVAKVAADTMNNYLMFDRLIKATYIPPEKQRTNVFGRATVTEATCRRAKNRAEHISRRNGEKVLEEDKRGATKMKRNVRALQKKLASEGIKYNFKPVNDPDDDDSD